MKRSVSLVLLGVALGALSVPAADDAVALREGFAEPPDGAKLQMWWHWVGNHVSEEGIRADLKAMSEAGVSTAYVFAPNMGALPPNALCMTPEWLRLFGVAIHEAKKNGLKLGFHNCPGWSSSGGPWITPENSMKVVVSSAVDADSTTAERIRLPQPRTTAGFYRDIAVYAFPVAAEPKPEGLVLPKVLGVKTPGTTACFELTYPQAITPRSLLVTTKDDRANGTLVVETWTDKGWAVIGKGSFSCWTACTDARTIMLDSGAPSRRFRLSYTSEAFPDWMGQRETVFTDLKMSELAFVENLLDANSSGNAYGCPQPADRTAPGLDPKTIVDLTAYLSSDGTLDLAAAKTTNPTIAQANNYRIVRLGCTSTGRGPAPTDLKGLECDKLNPRGIEAHWAGMPAKILALPEAKETIRYAIIDSYEVGGQNWTDILPVEFEKRRGYALGANLLSVCGYVIGDQGKTADFLWDYQRTVSELFEENYFGRFAELCHENGIEAILEPYGGPFDAIRCGRHADVPTGEFWLGRDVDGTPRLAASIAHLYGKTKVAAEAFTTDAVEGRWLGTPAEYRRVGDSGWLAGVNQIVFHSYVHQPWVGLQPGLSLGRHGSQFNKNTTWWPEARHWTKYVQRGQFLLQSGKPRTDILTTFPGAHKDVVAAGYSYDFIDEHSLQLLHVREGRVFMPGCEPYDVLSLHPGIFYSSETRAHLTALEKAGARIVWEEPLAAARKQALRPSVEASGIRGIRRRLSDGTLVYFLLNQSGTDFNGRVALTTERGFARPSAFDAKTGHIAPLAGTQPEDGRVEVRLSLRKEESAFVVLEKGVSADALSKPVPGGPAERVLDFSTDWTITSFKGPNAPASPLVLSKLASWGVSGDEKLRYFAGRAVYEKTVDLPQAVTSRLLLDLGAVHEVVNVFIDEQFVGCLWEPPYRLALPPVPARFTLRLEVINTWPNRLIGDARARKAGAAEAKGAYDVPTWVLENRTDSGTGIFTWSNWLDGWTAEDEPIAAGLLGPVRLEVLPAPSPLAGIPWIGDDRPVRHGADWYRDDPAPVFRAEFVLPKGTELSGPKAPKLHFATPACARIVVNDRRMPFARDSLFPLWSPFDKTVYTETFSENIAWKRPPQTNTVYVTLGNGWYNMPPLRFWGSLPVRERIATGRPCFKLAIEGINALEWEWTESQIVQNSYQLGQVIDARRPPVSAWRRATVADGPKGRLVENRVPRIATRRWGGLEKPVSVRWVGDGVQVVDFGTNLTAWWCFGFKDQKRDDRIEVRYGERLNADGTVNVLTQTAAQIKKGNGGPGAPEIAMQRDVLIVGDQTECGFDTTFTWHVGRYAEIRGAREFVQTALRAPLGCAVEPNDPGKSFGEVTDDAELKAIHEICQRTFLSNLMGVQSDCPGRERFGYGGDIVATCEAYMLNYDMKEFYLKTLQDFADEAEDDGWITETAPYVGIADAGGLGGAKNTTDARVSRRAGPVSWSLVVPVLMDALMRHYPDTTDRALAYYPVCARYVELMDAVNPSGYVPRCIGDHEALERAPDDCTATAHWHAFVRLTAGFAEKLGKTEDVRRYRAVQEKIRKAFVEKFVKEGIVANGTQSAQAIGLYLGLVPRNQVAAAEARLVKAIEEKDFAVSTGIFSTRYMLMYLSEHGKRKLAERVVRHKGYPGWLHMIDRGATTLWETWKESDDVFSNCHPMFGSVDEWILKYGKK